MTAYPTRPQPPVRSGLTDARSTAAAVPQGRRPVLTDRRSTRGG